MLRAVALSIVLTLAAGPTAAQLCEAWCSAQSAASSGCHPDASSTDPSLASNCNCDGGALSVGGFFREEVERAGPAPHASDAVRVPRYQVPLLTTTGRPAQQVAYAWSLGSRPLTTALRI